MKPLKPTELVPADQDRAQFTIILEDGVTIDDVVTREYWSAVAHTLRPGTRIEVSAYDGSLFADLIVRDVGKKWADVVVHQVSRHAPVSEGESANWTDHYTIRHARDGFHEVLRKSDGAKVIRLPTEEEAKGWIISKLRG